MAKSLSAQRLVIYEDEDGRRVVYSTVYGDEQYANRMVERCGDRYSDKKIYVLNSDAMPLA